MTDVYRLAADHAPPSQYTLGLQVRLDPPTTLSLLQPGDRFLLESSGTEGKMVSRGTGSATVAIRGPGDRWSRTTWSLNTAVRPMRG